MANTAVAKTKSRGAACTTVMTARARDRESAGPKAIRSRRMRPHNVGTTRSKAHAYPKRSSLLCLGCRTVRPKVTQ
jgi:hypothetical protein